MISRAFLLADAGPGASGAESAAHARLVGEVRRHGVERTDIVVGRVAALRDLSPRIDGPVFVLSGAAPLDINLWDLALAAGGGSALAVTSAGTPGGVAVLDPNLLRRLPDGDLFAALGATPDLVKRPYDRPALDLSADVVRGAVIFDRDGVINEDTEFPYLPDHIVWTPTGKAAVKAVNDAGLYAFVATNQSGVARGMYSEQSVIDLHHWMNGELIAAGAHIDAFQYSPFHPDGTVEAYRRDSDCRKPGPRMLKRLIEAHGVDRRRTVMIGDRAGDVAAGLAAGVEGLLFEGGDLAAFLAPVIARLTG